MTVATVLEDDDPLGSTASGPRSAAPSPRDPGPGHGPAAGAYGWLRDPRYDAGLDELAALEVTATQLLARQARVLARLASRTSRTGWQGEAPFESLLLDVAGSCVLGQVAAGSRLTDAEHLVLRLPGALELMEAGSLRVHQVRVLLEQTRELSATTCAELERRVLPVAGPLCPADLRRLLKRLVLQLESEDVQAAREAEQRRRQARADRRTWVRPAEDGMAVFGAVLPAEQAKRLQARLTEQARQARAAGDGRGLDQLRADLLAGGATGEAVCRGACGGRPGARPRPPVQVVVHVPLAVALGLSDAPAELEGYEPIDAEHARRLLPGAELRRACIDPESGRVWALDDRTVRLPQPGGAAVREREAGPVPDGTTGGAESKASGAAEGKASGAAEGMASGGAEGKGVRDHDRQRSEGGVDEGVRAALLALAALPPPVPLPPEPRHDPSAALSRLVRLRQVRCDGVGCSVASRRCELDHDVRWPDGATSATNLRPRSQRCHHAKHSRWTATPTGAGTTWTSPGGRRYPVPDRTPVHLPGLLRQAGRDEVEVEDDGPLAARPAGASGRPDVDLCAHDCPRDDGPVAARPTEPPETEVVDLRPHDHPVGDVPAPF